MSAEQALRKWRAIDSLKSEIMLIVNRAAFEPKPEDQQQLNSLYSQIVALTKT